MQTSFKEYNSIIRGGLREEHIDPSASSASIPAWNTILLNNICVL